MHAALNSIVLGSQKFNGSVQSHISAMDAINITDAAPLDAGKIGAILSEHTDLTDWHPRTHSRAEDVHFASRMIELGWVRVARLDGVVAGFLARNQHDIVALYIHGSAQRQGLGKKLMQDAKRSPAPLTVWCYVQNTSAQTFYVSENFKEERRTDGGRNELKLPDIKYVWRDSI